MKFQFNNMNSFKNKLGGHARERWEDMTAGF